MNFLVTFLYIYILFFFDSVLLLSLFWFCFRGVLEGKKVEAEKKSFITFKKKLSTKPLIFLKFCLKFLFDGHTVECMMFCF